MHFASVSLLLSSVSGSKKMLSSLSSTISRLNLFYPKPSIPYSLSSCLKILKPQPIIPRWSPLHSLSTHSTSRLSTSLKPQFETLVSKDDLVVLGIETSCDDTAAAVVCQSCLSWTIYCFWFSANFNGFRRFFRWGAMVRF